MSAAKKSDTKNDEDAELARQLRLEVDRLRSLEKQLAKMRLDLEQRCKLWDAVRQEIETLEEKAVIYRYKVVNTQNTEGDEE